ncbi:MAG: DUF2155 domain-containing protein [Hyphomicrobiaceae bacterium]|jgi:hypothetical protein
MRRLSILIAALAATATAASAQRLENRTAVFSALDKVTARISVLEVELDKTARFGSLKVTPRACYSRPATELPKTSTFVEVEEVQLDGTEKRIFAGWMFAESPGLHAVEHPVFDVWLTGCTGAQTVAQRGQSRPATPDSAAQQSPAEPIERRRVRR